jgi:hypothetical protein
VSHLCLKWFQHHPDDDPAWGAAKPSSTGRTLSLLAAPGAFALTFRRGERQLDLVLEQAGDFVLWAEGLEHSGSLFSYVSIEERIPASHPLRRIRKLADQALDRLNPKGDGC